MSDAIVTPGQGRLIVFQVGANEFGFRRPSRADELEAARRAAYKVSNVAFAVTAAAKIAEAELVRQFDPGSAKWDAILEVGLRPRKDPDGKPISIGERCPDHWKDGDSLNFDNVDPDEYADVIEKIDELHFEPKKKARDEKAAAKQKLAPSGGTANDQTKG